MSNAVQIKQARKMYSVDVSVEDQVLSPAPALIKNNQSTGALIRVLLEGDEEGAEQTLYFDAGEVLNAKVIKVYKLETTSTNIIALTN